MTGFVDMLGNPGSAALFSGMVAVMGVLLSGVLSLAGVYLGHQLQQDAKRVARVEQMRLTRTKELLKMRQLEELYLDHIKRLGGKSKTALYEEAGTLGIGKPLKSSEKARLKSQIEEWEE